MPDLQYSLLPEPLRPLLDKFYRAHRSPMRAVADAQIWVARHTDILAGLCLRPLREGYWLTGLLVDPASRGQGLARGLVEHIQGQCRGAIWLFCHPDLEDFYGRLGFADAANLPAQLCERLVRYQRNKAMVALEWQPEP